MKNKYQYPYYEVPQVNDLKELIDCAADKYNDKTAFMFDRNGGDVKVSFAELKNDIDALGTYFFSLGLHGEKIVIYGENSYEWILTYFAAVNGSNIIVPIDKELGAAELKNLVNDCGATTVVYSKRKSEAVEAAKPDMPNVERYILTSEISECIDKGMALMQSGSNEFLNNKIDREALCAIIYTSGTTGKPKGVMLCHRNLASDTVNSSRNFYEGDGTVGVLPLNHTFGFTATVLCQILRGHGVYINNSLKKIMRDMQAMKPRHISVVPLFMKSFYKNIWKNAEKQGKADALRKLIKVSNAMRRVGIDMRPVFFKSIIAAFGGNLNLIISGGAPIDQKYVKGFDDIGINIMNGYGITECSPIVSTSRNKATKPGSVGLAVPGTTVKVDNPDANGEGELLVKGDIVMMGYYNDPERTAQAIQDGWFRTGDIGRVDEDGFIFITGRQKNLIILSNGKNVYPEEIEAVIEDVEGVNEVMVYGKDDVICAEIYTETPEEKERIKKDVQALNDTLPSHKQVKNITFRDTEFEKTSTKKIKRFLY